MNLTFDEYEKAFIKRNRRSLIQWTKNGRTYLEILKDWLYNKHVIAWYRLNINE